VIFLDGSPEGMEKSLDRIMALDQLKVSDKK